MKNYSNKRTTSPADIPGSIEQQIDIEHNLQLLAKVFDNALEGIIITDEKAHIIAVNQSFTNITGYQASQVLTKNPRLLKSARHGADFYREMWRSIKKRQLGGRNLESSRQRGSISGTSQHQFHL